MREKTENIVDMLTERLRGRVDAFEIYVEHTEGVTVEARHRCVDSVKVTSSQGVGIRVIKDRRLGFGFSSTFDERTLGALIEEVTGGISSVSEDSALVLPEPLKPSVSEDSLAIYDTQVEFADTNIHRERALKIEESAYATDRRIRTVRKAVYGERRATFRTLNSEGVDVRVSATFCSGSVMAVATENGDSQMGWWVEMSHRRDQISPEETGRRAAKKAVEILGARELKSGLYPVILENTVMADILGVLGGAFLASNTQRGKSMLADKRGKKVFSREINIWDDGLLPGGWATSPCDCEGVPRRKTPLVVEGICQGFLYDTYHAKRENTRSTGNAQRMGFLTTPSVGISNLYIEKGEHSTDELVETLRKGILITEVMGVHTIDTVTGEFSLGATGFLVENGRLAYPVRGIAIAGSLFELLGKAVAVADDMYFIGPVGTPSVMFEELNISGM